MCSINLLYSTSNKITLKHINVQKQCGSSDCGLFTIACATVIVYVISPGQYHFDQSKMRRHECLQQRKVTMFPWTKERRGTKKCISEDCISIYRRSGFDCEILLIAKCEFFHNSQSKESQEKEYAMNNITRDHAPFVQMLNTCSQYSTITFNCRSLR